MRIALDPYMIRHLPLLELPGVVADLGYEWIELSPREDFLPFFRHPRVDLATVRKFRQELDAAGVGVATVLPLYRWAGPDEDERQAAVRNWKRAIDIASELGVSRMVSEFNGRPEAVSLSENQFFKSLEELLPIFERKEIDLVLEPHPDDFIEDGIEAIDVIRGIDSPRLSYLYCAPHTFHIGSDPEKIIKHAGSLLTDVHLADSLDFNASSGLRYIINPPGSTARIHQHLNIGQGEVRLRPTVLAVEADRLRRPADRLRLRVGGQGRGVQPVHAGEDQPALGHRRLAPPPRLSSSSALTKVDLLRREWRESTRS